MTQFQLSLITLALITALCYYIYTKDRVEKEPLSLLALLFGAGVLAFFPVHHLQRLITGLFDKIFEDEMTFTLLGVKEFTSTGAMISHGALCAFFGIALVEELVRWLILFLVTRDNRHYNCLFDGVVYSTFMSFGFALSEGLRYAIVDGADMFLSRFINALSVHLFFGVLVGYFFTAWKMKDALCRLEKEMFKSGETEARHYKRSRGRVALGLCFTVITHGIFELFTFIDFKYSDIAMTLISLALYIAGFIGVRHLSSVDGTIEQRAREVVLKCHKKEDPTE